MSLIISSFTQFPGSLFLTFDFLGVLLKRTSYIGQITLTKQVKMDK